MEFLPQYARPVGPNASKLSSTGGMEVRTRLLDLAPQRWSDVPEPFIKAQLDATNKQLASLVDFMKKNGYNGI